MCHVVASVVTVGSRRRISASSSGRQLSRQGGAGQPLRLLVAGGPIEQHDRFRHQWPTSWVLWGQQLQRALAQIRRSARIAVGHRLCGLAECGDRGLIARLSAADELGCDLLGRRPHVQHDFRRLPLHRSAQRLRQRLPRGFAQQIVTKPHLITVFDEEVGADSLFYRRHQGGRSAVEHRGEQPGREPVTAALQLPARLGSQRWRAGRVVAAWCR